MSAASDELWLGWSDLWIGLVSGVGIYLAVVLLVRAFGQRSLTSLSSFDFPVSVAIGAVVGRTALTHTSLAGGVVALATLFTSQALLGQLRNRTKWFRPLIEREPVLLVARGRILSEGLARAHLTREDVMEKLRLAGVCRLEAVTAMVIERSGSTSVLTSDDVDDALLENVQGAAALRR